MSEVPLNFDIELFAAELKTSPLGVLLPNAAGYRMIPASLDPLIIDDAVWASVAKASELALRGMNAIVERWRQPGHKAFAERIYAELSPLEQHATSMPGPAELATARLDLFFDRDGLKIIEANTTIPAMQAYSDIIRKAWLKALGCWDGRSPNSEDLLASLLFLYAKNRPDPAPVKPHIAIVARHQDSQTAELLYLQNVWQSQGYTVTLRTPGELEQANGKLCRKGHPDEGYDLIYRHIFASRLDGASAFARSLLRPKSYGIYNPISAHLEIKALFAELSHYAGDDELATTLGFSSEERRLLNQHLPWTRILRTSSDPGRALAELKAWRSLPPTDYVIKSSSGYGGHTVFMGSHFHEPSTQERLQVLLKRPGRIDWAEFIDHCVADPTGLWIIQRRMQGHRMKHQFLCDKVLEQESYVDASIFAWAHTKPRGGASRFAIDPIVNLGRGGGLLPMFIRSEYDALLAPEKNSTHSASSKG